jgi:hypothetical protein
MAKWLYEIDRLAQNYRLQVARGRIENARPFGAFGEVTTSGGSSGVIWPNGTFVFPTAAGITLSAKSTSNDDSAAGTGVQVIDVHGLDSELSEVEEEVVMNGQTAVPLVRQDWRFVQCTHSKRWGAGKVAAGTITLFNGAQIYSEIAQGAVRCSSSVRMVPKGKRLHVEAFFGGGIGEPSGARVQVYAATPSFEGHDFIGASVFVPIAAAAFYDSSSGLAIPTPFSFTEGQAFGMTFKTNKAAVVNGTWFGFLEPV